MVHRTSVMLSVSISERLAKKIINKTTTVFEWNLTSIQLILKSKQCTLLLWWPSSISVTKCHNSNLIFIYKYENQEWGLIRIITRLWTSNFTWWCILLRNQYHLKYSNWPMHNRKIAQMHKNLESTIFTIVKCTSPRINSS